MNNEYIIINKTALEKKIEELENKRDSEHNKGHYKSALRYENTILELKQLLSQSTPLIPEIEKAFDAGKEGWYQEKQHSHGFYVGKFKGKIEHYISNLKLDI